MNTEDCKKYSRWNTTDNGKIIPFSDLDLPTKFVMEHVKGAIIEGEELLLPTCYDIHTLVEEYEKSKISIQEYENYMLTSNKRYLRFDSAYIPVDFIIQEAPGTVIIDDIIRIPNIYNMDFILKRYNERVCPEPTANPVDPVDPVNPVDPVDKTNKILEERKKTHGDFRDHAYYTQSLKSVIRESANYNEMSVEQMEALDMIVHKIGRILAGNPNFKDHWVDIEGYAKLVSRDL